MQKILNGIVWSFCCTDCMQKNVFLATEMIVSNTTKCTGCASKNIELLCVFAGGKLPPSKEQQVVSLLGTAQMDWNENEMKVGVEARRSTPSNLSNSGFYEFIRSRGNEVGPNYDERKLAIESAYKWSYMTEKEKQIYKEPTTFHAEINFGNMN